MLPDTLQNLPRDERYAYARLLAYMARVDEEITVDELAMFEQQLGKALLSPNQREVLRRSLDAGWIRPAEFTSRLRPYVLRPSR